LSRGGLVAFLDGAVSEMGANQRRHYAADKTLRTHCESHHFVSGNSEKSRITARLSSKVCAVVTTFADIGAGFQFLIHNLFQHIQRRGFLKIVER